MPIAVVVLDFDPIVRIGDRFVRLESLAIAAAVFVALLVAAAVSGRPGPGRERLRLDDVLYLALAIVPGAVVGGRLGYAIVHLDYYGTRPLAVLDPGQGSLQLGLGLVGGALTGAAATRLLGEPVRRWADLSAIPMLVAIVGGKVGLALGGTGQGLPADVPWATSYLGPGPWGSLGPSIPSHPAQLYEAGGLLLVLAAVIALRARRARTADGRLFLAALGGWALVRLLVGATFREAPVLGPLRADQLVALAVLAGTVAFGLLGRRPAIADARVDSPGRSIVGDPGK